MAHTPSPASCTHLARGESPTLCPSHCVLDGKQAFPLQTYSPVAEDQPQSDQVIRHDPPLPRPVMSPWRQLQQRCTESTVCKDESSAECSEGSDTLMCSVSAPVWLQMSLQGFNRWRRPGSDFSGEARGEESTRARTHAHARRQRCCYEYTPTTNLQQNTCHTDQRLHTDSHSVHQQGALFNNCSHDSGRSVNTPFYSKEWQQRDLSLAPIKCNRRCSVLEICFPS